MGLIYAVIHTLHCHALPLKMCHGLSYWLTVSCPAGNYQVDNEMIQVNDDGSETVILMPKCVECPTNTYQYLQGQTQCVSCPDHHITHNNNTRLLEDCIMMCSPGEYSNDGLVPCSKCPIGQHQSSYGQSKCVMCPEYHSTRNNGSQGLEDCLPLCSPGEYSDDGLAPCSKCPIGQYQNSFGQPECVMCTEYHSTRNNGSQGLGDCLPLCSPGQYSDDGFAPCSKCPTGQYQDSFGQPECVMCPEYHSTRSNGSQGLDDCLPLCSPGEYSDDGFAPCSKCPTGQYQDSFGQPECVMCPENHSTRSNGSQGLEDCLPLCSPGQYSDDGFAPCSKCPAGQYQDSFGQPECVMCTEYHSTRSNGSKGLEDCLPLCSLGEYSADGLEPCMKCPIRQYQNSPGQLECTTCPDGYSTRSSGSQEMNDCLPLCSAGNYSTDGFEPCKKCPCGSYSDEYGAIECYNCSATGAPQDQCLGKDKNESVMHIHNSLYTQVMLNQDFTVL